MLSERKQLQVYSRNASTCGVNLATQPQPHCAGNFWWARCDHVRALPPPVLGCWTCGEMWLHSGGAGGATAHGVLHTGKDHYNEDYPESEWPDHLRAPATGGSGGSGDGVDT